MVDGLGADFLNLGDGCSDARTAAEEDGTWFHLVNNSSSGFKDDGAKGVPIFSALRLAGKGRKKFYKQFHAELPLSTPCVLQVSSLDGFVTRHVVGFLDAVEFNVDVTGLAVRPELRRCAGQLSELIFVGGQGAWGVRGSFPSNNRRRQ